MDISVEQVKKLRNKTGAGMMDCKKALVETGGDFEKAIDYLRKKGAATASKRSDRVAKEGLAIAKTSSDRKQAAIIEVNCETDFVARSEAFVDFTNKLISFVLDSKSSKLEAILNAKLGENLTVQSGLDELTGKVGEKVGIQRASYLESNGGFFCEYNHVGNKVVSVIEIEGAQTDEGLILGNDLAMQVVAMKPSTISRDEVSKETLDREREIYYQQALNEKKPENIAMKIADGRTEKYYQENCLLEQEFVKEPGKTVKEIVANVSKATGHNYIIKSMVRFQLGENVS